MYRDDWHARHRSGTQHAADRILERLFRVATPRSVLDVGCGHGDWLRAAQDMGAAEILGCDGPWTSAQDLVIPRDRLQVHDLRQRLCLGRTFDLVLCTEVGEHLPKESAADLVDSLVTHGDAVFFGAAIPYQGGYRHVNEQWPSWWRDLFIERGFVDFDPVRRLIWTDPRIDFWYKQNPILYIRSARADLVERAQAAEAEAGGAMPLDVVHPEKYMAGASYRIIAFKPLLRALPSAAIGKLHAVLASARH